MKQDETDKQPKRPKTNKSLKDKIHKHISDRNDVISEEDLKNVEIGEASFSREIKIELRSEEDR